MFAFALVFCIPVLVTFAGTAAAAGAETAAVGAVGVTGAAEVTGVCANPTALVNKVAVRMARLIFFMSVAPSCKKQMLHHEKRVEGSRVDAALNTSIN